MNFKISSDSRLRNVNTGRHQLTDIRISHSPHFHTL